MSMKSNVYTFYPNALCECVQEFQELYAPVLKADQLRSECDKLEKLCKFLQERLDEVSTCLCILLHTYNSKLQLPV